MVVRFLRRCALIAALVAGWATLAAAEDLDVVDVLKSRGFTTLSAAIESAGLADILKSEASLTIFAPSEAAFASMSDDERLLLMQDKKALRAFILSHVARGDVSDERAMTIDSLSTEPLRLERAGVFYLVNGVPVGAPAVAASNGMIHRIDALLPPALPLVQ